jgi:beta-lactamase class A
MMTRRQFAAGASAAAMGNASAGILTARAADRFGDHLAELERQSGGRLGVAVLDTAAGAPAPLGHRADERFPMCSTFKLLATAAILARVDAGTERLDRRIRFEASDVVVNSAVTKDRAGGAGMTLDELCAAAMTFSDNTAGNLLLASLGGVAAINAYARALGDAVTRLDRIEPDLNEALPGDPRDTTTPAAMLGNLRSLALGDALSAESKERLTNWLLGNRTGDARLRAGIPGPWRVGDKTGSGERGTTNDIGILWPPGRAPTVLTIYLTGTSAGADQRNATIAAVGRAVALASA